MTLKPISARGFPLLSGLIIRLTHEIVARNRKTAVRHALKDATLSRFLDIIAPSDTMKRYSDPFLEGEAVNIEIHDAALKARIQKQLQATGSASVEEVLLRLLETQEEQDRWLLENREAINTKIKRGIEQLDHGAGIPEDKLDGHLTKLKNQT